MQLPEIKFIGEKKLKKLKYLHRFELKIQQFNFV